MTAGFIIPTFYSPTDFSLNYPRILLYLFSILIVRSVWDIQVALVLGKHYDIWKLFTVFTILIINLNIVTSWAYDQFLFNELILYSVLLVMNCVLAFDFVRGVMTEMAKVLGIQIFSLKQKEE